MRMRHIIRNLLSKASGTLLILLLSHSVQAQDQHITSGERSRTIDSLKSVIDLAEHDTSVCIAYLSWGEEVYLNNPDTALILWQKAHDIAERNLASSPPTSSADGSSKANAEEEASAKAGTLHKKYLSTLADALNNIGYIYENQGDIPKGLEYYHKSLKIKEEIGNKKGIATSLNNIGYIYMNQGDIPKALEYWHKSLKIREEIGDKEGIATSLNNIGAIYNHQGDIPNALEYFHKSLKIKEEIGDKRGIAISLNNIGLIYMNQGDIPKALEYYHKCLKIDEEIGDKKGIAISLNNIGVIYYNQGDIPKALEYYHKCLKIDEEIGNKQGIASSLKNIGSIEFKQGQLTNALNYAMRGLEIAQEIGSPHLISINSGLLSKVAKQQGNYQEALEMYELHILMRDSINNEETQKASIRQQTKYEFEKAQLIKEQEEKETARLESEATSRRDNLQYSVILIALLVLFGGVLSLGFVKVSPRMAEGIIFFSFLILFEFLLVLADPYIENWSGGAPGFKLLFNAGVAALIFPMHSLFETKLKGRLVKS